MDFHAVAGRTLAGRLVLAHPAPAGGYAFRLSSTHPAVVLPATVTVPAGVTTRSFRILTPPVASLTAVDVRATWREVQTASATLQVRPIGPKRVDLTPNPVVGGHEVLGIVTLECPAGPGDIPLSLSSTPPATAAPSPSLLVMPAGSQTASFAVSTVPTPATVRVSIKARANDLTKAKALTVTP